jgi:DNA mismatch repair protein MLH1
VRFATSKINTFGDLRKVRSFGFRGEALCSISFVSKVTVTSKIKGSELAYIADFLNGDMIEEDQTGPKPIAGQEGTTIQVRDMFYNNLQRKKSIGLNEEYSKIVEVVTRYAIHYPMTRFSCRKMDDKKTDVSTHNIPRPTPIEAIRERGAAQDKQLNLLRIEIIKKTYGQTQAGKEFLDFS